MKEDIAEVPFKILTFLGLWRPLSWTSWKKIIYNIYTVVMLIVLITTMIVILVAVCDMPMTDDVFAENIFLAFAVTNAVFKGVNILLSRHRFIKMLTMTFNENWQKSHDLEEMEIRKRYSKTIRKISIYFTSAVFISIVIRIMAPLLETNEDIKLPIAAYRPCDVNRSGCYWSLYLHQAIGTATATLTHAGKDCLISALLLQTCLQLELLKHRILNISKLCDNAKNRNETPDVILALEKSLITACVRDHQSIFKFANTLNDSLNILLFGQLAVTLPNLCLSIYLMSKQSIASLRFMMTTQFFLAVVIELFFFCWYGNEVTLNSQNIENAFREMDWTTLSTTSRKDLLMIMRRTSKPILFNVGPIMNMNINSFLSIMKTSYSAFSVLQSVDT